MLLLLSDIDDLMDVHGVDALFLEGESIHKPNLYYLTRFLSLDNVYCVKLKDQPPILAGLEMILERARKLSPMRNFYNTDSIWNQGIRERKTRNEIQEQIVVDLTQRFLSDKGVVGISRDTDAFILHVLQRSGVKTKPVHDLFLRARETKSNEELRAIQKASRATESTFKKIVEVFQNTEIGPKNILEYNGTPLTVAQVKRQIEHSLVDNDSENSQESIVAGGSKGADYHYFGQRKDRLRAHEPIIVDIYPRRIEERYHADITRTIVRGNVSPQVKKMFEAVESALDAVIDAFTANNTTDVLVNAMADSFERNGYPSKNRKPEIREGMLHALGHGIGLDVHELPRLSITPYPLTVGAVAAIEPGLYYKRVGGVRIEDDVIITGKGAKTITRLPRTFFL